MTKTEIPSERPPPAAEVFEGGRAAFFHFFNRVAEPVGAT